MNTSDQTERHGKWKALVEEQERSGQTQKQFCKERGLVLSQFVYYRSVVRMPMPTHEKPSSTVIPITIKSAKNGSESQIKLILPNGFQCALPISIDPAYVKCLMKALLSC